MHSIIFDRREQRTSVRAAGTRDRLDQPGLHAVLRVGSPDQHPQHVLVSHSGPHGLVHPGPRRGPPPGLVPPPGILGDEAGQGDVHTGALEPRPAPEPGVLREQPHVAVPAGRG